MLHPISWIVIGAACIAQSYILPAPIALMLGLGVLSTYLAVTANRRDGLKRLTVLMFPIILAAAFVQLSGGVRPGEIAWFRSPFLAFGPERANALLSIWARMSTVIGLGLFVTDRATTPAIKQFVSDMRLPWKVARVLLSARGFVQLARANASTVIEAQSLRGLPLRGSVAKRSNAIATLAVPLMANLFIEAANRSAALERRGFTSNIGGLPTPRPLRTGDLWTVVACMGLLIFEYL